MVTSAAILEMVRTSVLLRLVGPDPSLVDAESRWTIAKFLQDVSAHHAQFTITLTAAQQDYTLPLVDTETATLVMEGFHGDSSLEIAPTPVFPVTNGTPLAVSLEEDNIIRFWPVPDANATLKTARVKVALSFLPTADVVTYPNVLRKYHDALFEGTLGRLYSIPDKPWTNLTLSTMHLSRFNLRMQRAARDLRGGGGVSRRRMRPPFFA